LGSYWLEIERIVILENVFSEVVVS